MTIVSVETITHMTASSVPYISTRIAATILLTTASSLTSLAAISATACTQRH